MNDETSINNHFIRQIVLNDRASGKHSGRIATRFPPEPNGYLHLGHAKSICLNFGIAHEFNGRCNLRFDDTNPAKEDIEYVESIKHDVQWLGFEWSELRHASDYFAVFYLCALKLIKSGHAYVDSLSTEEIREHRGTLTQIGKDSPYRSRSIAENLDLFERMRAGEFVDGAHILRAKIDMAAANINLRDPALYRIRKIAHQNTGDTWCIYPMYDFAHVISDAVEGITHSLCTLEFEDHRPLYDWCLDQLDLGNDMHLTAPLRAAGLAVTVSRPQQIEFARGNLDYTVMSKRKLLALVQEGLVEGWDDPRMPTLSGVRRRGFPAAAIRTFWQRAGVTKQNSVIEYSVLENCVREELDASAPRRLAVLAPLRLIITNLSETHTEMLTFHNHPKNESFGTRSVPLSRELWIEREDFMETPAKGFHRLSMASEVRLRGIGIVRCDEIIKTTDGSIAKLHCTLDLNTRHGMPGADRKVKGTIHWVSAKHALAAEIRLYDRLFNVPNPDKDDDGKSYRDYLNPTSRRIMSGWVEPSLSDIAAESSVQFERLGYFVSDLRDSRPGKPVFNRSVTLRDAWTKPIDK